jgi:hypothetical protein
MKKINYALIAILAAGLSACSVKDDIRTESNAPEAALTHEPLGGYCLPTTVLPLGDATSDIGMLEINHAQDPLHILFSISTSSPWAISLAYIYEGSPVPLTPSGSVDISAFVPEGGPPYSAMLDINYPVTTNACRNFSLAVDMVRLDFFGNVVETRRVWAKGTAVGNDGYQFTYCNPKCLDAEVTPGCVSIMPGYTSSCATLTASAVVGTATSYAWSNGATTAGISACPTSSTTYTVTITDASGVTATASADVIVLSAPCGAGKIQICHYPPGGGSQDQCKSASWVYNYLDTHGGIAALVPGASGITLGPCEAPIVPCL